MESNGINFSNPQEISKEDLSEVFSMGLSFDGPDTPEDVEEKEKEKPVLNTVTKIAVDSETETETEDSDSDLSINSDSEEEAEVPVFNSIVNLLADKGIIETPYEGFDPEADADAEVLTKLIEHNVNLKVEQEFDAFYEKLSPITQRILNFELNSTDPNQSDLDVYLKTLIEENSIKSLSLDNEFDQEKILREWYRNEDKFTQAEVDDKINDLREANLIEKEAKRIKPKLDAKAEEIARQKESEQRALKEAEQKVFQDYSNRVVEKLKEGQIGGVTIDREDASKLYTIMTSDRMEVTVHGGKKAMMTPLEYLMFFNKYDNRGNLDNLMLATMLLTNPAKFEESYAKRVETKNTNEFVRQHKYNSKLKSGQIAEPTKKDKTPTNQKWRMKID